MFVGLIKFQETEIASQETVPCRLFELYSRANLVAFSSFKGKLVFDGNIRALLDTVEHFVDVSGTPGQFLYTVPQQSLGL